jgi:iron complex transport system substrate-binding protein
LLPAKPKNLIQRGCVAALLFAAIFAFLLACSRRNAKAPQAEGRSTREVVDEAGRHVSVPLRIERIVSLAPNVTEIVYAIGAGDRLVGDTEYCDYPSEAKRVAKVGDTLHPSAERIVALHPQVVLVSTASQLESFTTLLAEHQIAVFVMDAHDLEGVFHSIQDLGDLFDEQPRAEKLVANLRNRTAAVENAVNSRKRIRVFYQLSDRPLYTAGRDSFTTDLIRRAGGESVTANVPGAWPRFSDESALASQPEAIILPTGGSIGTANSEVAEPLKKSAAVRSGRVYKINDDHLSRPGPRLVDGLEELARALHPESFKP